MNPIIKSHQSTPSKHFPANITVIFKSSNGKCISSKISMPLISTPTELQLSLNSILNNSHLYSFYIENIEICKPLSHYITSKNSELIIPITYDLQAPFLVKPVTRCTSTLKGHDEAILVVKFSPNSKYIATGSGDAKIKIWDINTETPKITMKGHNGWIQTLEWSPNNNQLVSGDLNGNICIWNIKGVDTSQKPIYSNKNGVLSISWEPFHMNEKVNRIVTGGKDGSIKVWNIFNRFIEFNFNGHTSSVTTVIWGGMGYIYSCSRDTTIKVWNVSSQKLIRTLKLHGHWVNHISINTEYSIRKGIFNDKCEKYKDKDKTLDSCIKRYNKSLYKTNELLVSGSDDGTGCLWNPIKSDEPISRLTGHQAPISFVKFSPNSKYIASASFDKSVRIWNGENGKFIQTLRGHVGSVYQISWSADSRYLVTGSKDSTLKLWEPTRKKNKINLPGHEDEVFAVDWSTNGQMVASGGRDKNLKIWRC